ncbi:MAG: carbamoyl-phosphate synthase large subunit, partial [Candidatus Brocadiia bacterium]|nr:carbamoyl-phosphate synthase large subunit [Candidatus Brocadiia bacterium]
MPKREDINSVLVIGSGPIVIGQACEFDYSGTQACKALRKEGYRVVLVNSNPATIMTDPDTADATYIEPITPEVVERIIERERPDALLPTLGGQTGLNTAVELWKRGVLQRLGCEMIGAKYEAIAKAEDREEFKAAMDTCGLLVPPSTIVRAELPERPAEIDGETLERYELERVKVLNQAVRDAREHVTEEIGLPCVIRPAYTLGGTGGGIAYNMAELEDLLRRGIENSLIGQVLVEESLVGWKEYELEVMRDANDNVVIICPIENFDPMGIHTGDSITVAPAQTLTDKEYQLLRDASIAIIREIGVDTGGSNIQFAVHPNTGRMVVIEMNPRVSRSSALASKATGFPIAKIAALLAVGYTLDEIPNDITKETYASFEPTIDYCVTKVPRWAFEKFPEADSTLTTQMKSVGETMAIGRTFKESLQKALRSLEIGRDGFEDLPALKELSDEELLEGLARPSPRRLFEVR